MRTLLHPATTAFGAASIFILILLAPLASPPHAEFYHLSGPVRAVLIPVLINYGALWLLLFLLMSWLRKGRRFNAAIWICLQVVLCWVLMKAWYSLHASPLPASARLIFLAVLLSTAAFLSSRPSHAATLLAQARQVSIFSLGFVACSGVVMLAQACFFSWQARDLNSPRPLHTSPTQANGRGPVICIVFDELSYRQLYEHRYPGLQLPAFDRLRSEASVFTHTIPAGLATDTAIPSLFTGTPVDSFRAPAAGWPLQLHDTSPPSWRTFDPHHTVFQDALDRGYRTSIAGWFNPYCRILAEVLDQCDWASLIALPGGMFAGQSIAWNAEQPVLHQLAAILASFPLIPKRPAESNEVTMHRQEYLHLQQAGDQMLRDASSTFLLLHLPIPHPGGIYDRKTASFTTSSTTYMDNLALCDLYLAHVRQTLEANGTWDETTLFIMGDHSWRVDTLWRNAPGWTQEEQAASDGARFDDRPAYIVKLAKQKTAAQIDKPFRAARTRALFDAIFTGRISTPQQLTDWANQGN